MLFFLYLLFFVNPTFLTVYNLIIDLVVRFIQRFNDFRALVGGCGGGLSGVLVLRGLRTACGRWKV